VHGVERSVYRERDGGGSDELKCTEQASPPVSYESQSKTFQRKKKATKRKKENFVFDIYNDDDLGQL
jgi:hypothetical protein